MDTNENAILEMEGLLYNIGPNANPPYALLLSAVMAPNKPWNFRKYSDLGKLSVKKWVNEFLPSIGLFHCLMIINPRNQNGYEMVQLDLQRYMSRVAPIPAQVPTVFAAQIPAPYYSQAPAAPFVPQQLPPPPTTPRMAVNVPIINTANYDSKSVPAAGDDLWRPFDQGDSFFNDRERMNQINRERESYWNSSNEDGVNSWLYDIPEERKREVFEKAYCKCTRLTIRISNVLNHEDIAQDTIKRKLNDVLQVNNCSNRTQLYVYKAEFNPDSGDRFSETNATIWAPGSTGIVCTPLRVLVSSFGMGHIICGGMQLEIFRVGQSPLKSALRASIKELSLAYAVTPIPLQLGFSSPVSVAPGMAGMSLSERLVAAAASPIPAVTAAAPVPFQPTLPPAPLWPPVVEFDSLDEQVVDPVVNPLMLQRNALLEDRERELRQICAVGENDQHRRCNGLEWIEDPTSVFFLGYGSEANIYLGLMAQKPPTEDAPVPPPLLVAVKQNHQGKNQFNSQENKFFQELSGKPGIIRYHTFFKFDKRADILVQDLGSMNLRQLVSGHIGNRGGDSLSTSDETIISPDYKLSDADNFRITKALCLAVHKLHCSKTINSDLVHCDVVHCDLRPENVLIMRDGTLCLTDFGLMRSLPNRSMSNYTARRITNMQPYEAHEMLQRTTRSSSGKIPLSQKGDVFMIGCVIAYVHLRKDPFNCELDEIAKKLPPAIDELKTTNPWLHHLLTFMLKHEKDERPTMEQVLKHPYFLTPTENFVDVLKNKLEHVLVRDYNAVDNEEFQALVKYLAPIEAEMKSSNPKWYKLMTQKLVTVSRGIPKADWLKFANTTRSHPLPEFSVQVKFLRNMLEHFIANDEQQELMRLSAGTTPYPYAGDFFMRHPSVGPFLPRFWLLGVQKAAEVRARRRAADARYKLECQQIEEDLEALAVFF